MTGNGGAATITPLMVVEKSMRYLLPGLAFVLAGCAVVSTWNAHNRVAAMVEDCESRGLTGRLPASETEARCVAEILAERCKNSYLSGKLGGYEDWIKCVGDDGDAYCSAYTENDKMGHLCGEIFAEVVWAKEPITARMLEASEMVIKQCRSRHESGKLPTWSAKAHCLNDGYDGVMRQYQVFANRGGYLRLARMRLEIARRLDAGTITESDVDQNWEHYIESCWVLPVSSDCRVR